MNMHNVLPSSQKVVNLVQQMLDDHLATSPSSVQPAYSYIESKINKHTYTINNSCDR